MGSKIKIINTSGTRITKKPNPNQTNLTSDGSNVFIESTTIDKKIGAGNSVDSNLINTYNSSITESPYSTIIGGKYNYMYKTPQSSILGGRLNLISGNSYCNISYNSIVGGCRNEIINSDYATVIGGYENCILGYGGDYSAIIAGSKNKIEYQSQNSAILAGCSNVIQSNGSRVSYYSTILGGRDNSIFNSSYSSILAGYNAKIFSDADSADCSVIIAGNENKIYNSDGSTVFGGTSNKIEKNTQYSLILGGNK